MRTKHAIFMMLAAAVAAPALAQYVGPGAQPAVTSLKAVLDRPVDDQLVVLRGTLVKQVSSDKYIFSDGAQEIRVEIDRDVFPARQIGPTTRVEIVGEVEKDFMTSPEIDVDTLRVID